MLSIGFTLATLSLVPAAVSSQQFQIRSLRQLDRELTNSYDDEETASGSDSFTSFFEVEYVTLDGTDKGLEDAAGALATAYNDLTSQFDDPFERQMAEVRVVSSEPTDASDYHERGLQNLSILALLEAAGTCFGCPSQFFFSNQIITRNLGDYGSEESPSLRSGVPSEEEILEAYSAVLQSDDFGNIVDATALDELEGLPNPTQKSTKGKGSKSSKGTKSSKSSKKSKSSKSSKSSKIPKSSKSSKSQGCRNPGGDAVEFTSFFRSLYAVIEQSSLGLEEAAGALTIAYNRIAPESARMENSFIFDETSGRRLSWKEAEQARKLQVLNVNAILEAVGTCFGCQNQFTFGNQIITGQGRLLKKGRGKGKGKGKGAAPICQLPTEEEVREEYNTVLAEMGGNVQEALEFEEIARPTPSPTPRPGKGKGKGSSSKSSRF